MKLSRVTITGADDLVEPSELLRLSRLYPEVEWAILFSLTRQGQSRYPSLEWVGRFLEAIGNERVKLAAHLCGRYVRELRNNNFLFEYVDAFERIQLNLTDHDYLTMDLQALHDLLSTYKPSFILRCERPFVRHEEIGKLSRPFEVLYDVSGGRGKVPKAWAKPVEGIRCGEAGGLNPDNIVEQLKAMEEVVGDATIWIDVESGVRKEADRFCIEKTENFLERVRGFVEAG
jgi:hypothetical protein